MEPVNINVVNGSGIHLSAEAINKVLEAMVNTKPGMKAQFVDGRLVVNAQGLTLVVEAVRIEADGVHIDLAFG